MNNRLLYGLPLFLCFLWFIMMKSGFGLWAPVATALILIAIFCNTLLNLTLGNKDPFIRWLMRICWVSCLFVSLASLWFYWDYFYAQGLFSNGISNFLKGVEHFSAHLKDAYTTLLMVASIGTGLSLAMLFLDLLYPNSNKHLSGKRKRADSDLYGDSDFMPEQNIREMSQLPGIVLGQLKIENFEEANKKFLRGHYIGSENPIISYPLEGNAISFAPPRSNKTSLIISHVLFTGRSGEEGSRLIIDPRGEVFFVCAEYLEFIGRNLVLLDPFNVISNEKPDLERYAKTYNPLDFLRKNENLKGDMATLLDALIIQPATKTGTDIHFDHAARIIIGGFIAWVIYTEPKSKRTLQRVYELLNQEDEQLKELYSKMKADPSLALGMPHRAALRCEKVGDNEGGSNFGIYQRILDFIEYPQAVKQTNVSNFDPEIIADENTDFFIVIHEDFLDAMKPWLRMWITISSAIVKRNKPKKNALFIIDELTSIGELKPVTDSYLMSSGSGISYWLFAHTIPILEEEFGNGKARTLIDGSEVLQILELPQLEDTNAQRVSKAMGSVTYESPSTSESASQQEGQVTLSTKNSSQVQSSTGLVRESLVPLHKLLKMEASEQYILVNSKTFGKNPIHCGKLRYWHRAEISKRAAPNPIQTRKA